ncbi:MAG: helix-turn-helix domain-containing protein [Butyrivibrio sp.]|nr:helix-turn-helix domain-containing protein [Butyrivibrio sp.]
MDFKELLLKAKAGQQEAIMALLEMYKPLLIKNAILAGKFDEDLYQELCVTFLRCIHIFSVYL